MPKLSNQTISEIIEAAVTRAVTGVRAAIERELAAAASEARSGAARGRRGQRGRHGGASVRVRSRRSPADLTRWVADRRARRVPKFVIAMTGGLDTKKKIVARYGANATFEKGKPLPKVR